MYNEAYQTIFGMSVAFTIASIAAFFFGQYVDVFVYHVFRKRHKGRFIWLRNNVSTIIGQFVDSCLWIFIAFSPRLFDGSFDAFGLFSTIVVPYWLAKVVIAFFDTPLIYLGVWWLKKKD
jgi:hypothetical protein